MAQELSVNPTEIPGLLILTLPVHGDNRGWFKENWQREKMIALGLPDFGPVQNNVSFNEQVGVTRGIHAEPWDKLVSVAHGRVFGAWVDLRAGDTFGTVVTHEIGPDTAVFVPYGVGNAFQTLKPSTSYSYLVNDHWSAAAREQYTYLNLADETAAIAWPHPLGEAETSEADRRHPRLAEVVPMPRRRTVIVGSGGQLGMALHRAFPEAEITTRIQVNLADPVTIDAFDWQGVGTILNAAAWTAVDEAETPEGRSVAWAVNATGVARLAEVARRRNATFVHVSSDYVFDGSIEEHPEDEALSPLGVYGQTKAAGELAAQIAPRHYLVRTSWVVGEGHNFVRTMMSLAEKGVSPSVIDDQHGRLTFTDDLAGGIRHLVESEAPYGVYNLTSDGPVLTWADIAARVFELCGRNPGDVRRVSTQTYAAGRAMAPRPTHSALRLDKIRRTGMTLSDGDAQLRDYVTKVLDRRGD